MGIGGGSDTINLFGFLFLAVMGALIIFLPRRFALIPIVLSVFYMTIGQQVVIAGLHFSIMRLMILFGWLRLVTRRELTGLHLNGIDKLLLAWQASRVTIHTLQLGSVQGFIEVSGYAFDAVGTYFLLRFLIRDLEEVPHIVKMISTAIIPLALLMLLEKTTTKNVFAVFGGVSPDTMVDEFERLRCQGPFLHPILAGTLGATLLPLFLGLWFQGRQLKAFAGAGIVSAAIIIWTAHSSGPLMAFFLTILGMMFWRYRHLMSVVRWGLGIGVVFLHLIMKDPVWALFGRLSEVIGGTGYHRTMLISAAINNFGEWWLLGTNYTAHWMPYTLRLDPTMADLTNQFIFEGVIGGLLTLILFVLLISLGFRAVGKFVNLIEPVGPFSKSILVWSLGVGLFAHVVSFMSVTYFDQNVVVFYLVLACISLCSDTGVDEIEST